MSRVIVHRLTFPIPPTRQRLFKFAALRNFPDHPCFHTDRHLIAHDRTSFVFSCVATLLPAMAVFISPWLLSLRQEISYTACLSCQYCSTPTVLWIAFILHLRCRAETQHQPASNTHNPRTAGCPRLPASDFRDTIHHLLGDNLHLPACRRISVLRVFRYLVEAANPFVDTEPCVSASRPSRHNPFIRIMFRPERFIPLAGAQVLAFCLISILR